MITGYKWTKGKQDGKLYIVTLLCNNEYPDEAAYQYDGRSYYTTDCTVEAIEDEAGNNVESVDGCAFVDFVYTVGQKIKGIRIFYVHDKGYIIRHSAPKCLETTKKQVEIWKAWNAAGAKAIRNPFSLYFDMNTFRITQEHYFFEMGYTIQDLLLMDER